MLCTNTPQCLSKPLQSLIESYFNDNLQNNRFLNYEIFDSQTSIGWKNYFRGHIAAVFQEYYELTDFCQEYWTFKLIKSMWSHIKDLWEKRNTYDHGIDSV